MKDLLKLVRILRTKCPWDREQTLKTLIVELIEEVYELNSVIEEENIDGIKEELGDIILGSFMMGIVLEEMGIKFDDIISKVHNKMIKRHPHVFGEDSVKTADEVLEKWEKRKGKDWETERSLPALIRSSKIQKRASRKGFDWEDISGVYDKIKEELDELMDAEDERDRKEELGDILFACAHLGNFININPEIALQDANNKFEERFRLLEESLKGKDIKDFSIDELEEIWQRIKLMGNQED